MTTLVESLGKQSMSRGGHLKINLFSQRTDRHEEQALSLNDMDIARRNRVVFGAMTSIAILTLTSILSVGSNLMSEPGLLAMIIVQILNVSIVGFLHFRRKWIYSIPYIAVSGTAVSSTITLFTNPSVTNILSIFFLVLLSLIYMNKLLTILAQVYGLGMLILMMTVQSDVIHFEEGSQATYIIYYILISIIIFALLYVSDYVMKQMRESHQKSESLMQQQMKQQETLISLVKTISENIHSVSRSSEENNRAFQEMNTAFQEITRGSNSQVESTIEINESVQEMNTKAQLMVSAMQTLDTETKHAKGLSDASRIQMQQLLQTISDFKNEIETMSAEITELNARLDEVNEFSHTIKDIAGQTNLLSLNASIEAARAGEHGRGFVIVASEIRKLADITSRSADLISTELDKFKAQTEGTYSRMTSVAQQMDESYHITQETNEAFHTIDAAIGQLNELAAKSTQFVSEMNQAIETIGGSTGQLASISQQTSASLEELTAWLQNLTESNQRVAEHLLEADKALSNAV